jgi:hypothetical protein
MNGGVTVTARRLSRGRKQAICAGGVGVALAVMAGAAWPGPAGASTAKSDVVAGVKLSAAPLGIDASPVDNTKDNVSGGTPVVNAVTSLLKAAGITQIHYGGGTYADEYDWQTDQLFGDTWKASLDFDKLSQAARAVGGQSFVSVNYGSGSPALAAAWVKQATGNPSQAVADWAIGNENYGCWEPDQYEKTCPGWATPATVTEMATNYATNALPYMKAMKAANPNAQIGVPWAFDGGVPGATVDNNTSWNDTVLGDDAQYINFVEAHYYPYNQFAGDTGVGGNPTAQAVIQSVQTIPGEYGEIEGTLGTYDPTAKVIIGETGASNLGTNVPCTPTGALFAAGDALEWLASGAQSVDWWPTDMTTASCTNDSEAMFTSTGVPTTPYYGYLLASALAQPNAQLSSVASGNSQVLEFRSVLPNGQTAVALINTNTSNAAKVPVGGLTGTLATETYSAGNQNAANTKVVDATTAASAVAGGLTLPRESIVVLKTLKPSATTLAATAGSYKAGTKVTLKGKLTLNNAAAPAGVTVKITRVRSGSKADGATLSAKTVAGGTFTLTNVPPTTGTYVYDASYSNSLYVPSSRSVSVKITAAKPALKLAASAKTVRPGRHVTVTATLGAPHVNRTLAIYAQPKGGAKKLIKRATINSKGQLAVVYTIRANTTFTVTFSGDTWYTSASATAAVKS